MSTYERGVRVLYDAAAIARRVDALGTEIAKAHADEGAELVLLAVLKGSFVFAADLMRAIPLPLRVDFLGLSSYGGKTETSGVVKITQDLSRPIEGAEVLVVEDIIDTGLTMAYLLENLATRKAGLGQGVHPVAEAEPRRAPGAHRPRGVQHPRSVRGRLRARLRRAVPKPAVHRRPRPGGRGESVMRIATSLAKADFKGPSSGDPPPCPPPRRRGGGSILSCLRTITPPHREARGRVGRGVTEVVANRRGFSFQGFLTLLFILALLAAVGFLLTERNQRRYFLRTQGDLVIVDRGLPLPYGHGPFHPSDPAQIKAYQPIHLPSDVAPPGEEAFDDRAELDQRLGTLLLQSARSRLAATDQSHLEDGIGLLAQADALPELTAEQRHMARQLRSEVAYVEATDQLARALAASLPRHRRDSCNLGAESMSAHAKDSAELLDRLMPLVESLQRAARGQGVMPADVADLPKAVPDAGTADAGR